jgi:putative oxidoreductase
MQVINLAKKYIEIFISYSSNLEHLLLLIARLWIADIFWTSGFLKISDIPSTIMLFTTEHPVPFLPPIIAAYSSILFELTCSTMLFLGLGARFAALPLIFMTAVIQFTYLQHTDHFYWVMLLGFILARGAGVISLDYFIKRFFNKNS